MCFNSELVTRWQWFIVTGERNNKKTTTKKKCGFFFEMNASNAKSELKVSLNLELRIGKLKWIYWEKCEEEEKKFRFEWLLSSDDHEMFPVIVMKTHKHKSVHALFSSLLSVADKIKKYFVWNLHLKWFPMTLMLTNSTELFLKIVTVKSWLKWSDLVVCPDNVSFMPTIGYKHDIFWHLSPSVVHCSNIWRLVFCSYIFHSSNKNKHIASK